jgi:hypothetical protein
LTEMHLCGVCSCQEILRRNGRGQEERARREASERVAQNAADLAAKSAAAAEIAADAAGASKVKRREAETRARELFNKVTVAEQAKQSAEVRRNGRRRAPPN